ncbi:venom allergen 5.02-like [Chelonus insularis]|uniref:venom allergen 5.02-like n=1 Tax=Chelonus insularis TaxID=460826 RepID=UPI00158F4C1A|nr:venom allergen 5.02-like [Chelonus insularis]
MTALRDLDIINFSNPSSGFDNIGPQCNDIKSGDLDTEEVKSILHQHNLYRNFVASGQEIRGNPGPQPPAKNMMELMWDSELEKLAKRWVLQCVPSKDECRDVSRFAVWQNIHILYIESLEAGTTGLHRIPLHVQSWSDDVENFDTAEVGLVDFARDNRGPYIGIAAGKITHVGCGRAMYSVDLRHLKMTDFQQTSRENKTFNNIHFSQTHQRLEVLVCNYGPIDRTKPQNLYDDGIPGQCPGGLTHSNHYEYLCKKKEDEDEEQWLERRREKNSSCRMDQFTTILFSAILGQFVINMLLSIG